MCASVYNAPSPYLEHALQSHLTACPAAYALAKWMVTYNHGQKIMAKKYPGKVVFLQYTERVKFRSQIFKTKTTHWALGSHPVDNGHMTH